MKKRAYTLQNHIKDSLKDPLFRKAWEKSEAEYQLGRVMIQKRLEKNMTQKELAWKAKTTQAVISRIESMRSNPSLATLKRIASAMGTKLEIAFK